VSLDAQALTTTLFIFNVCLIDAPFVFPMVFTRPYHNSSVAKGKSPDFLSFILFISKDGNLPCTVANLA
jgi:hypothetical protein